jgi:hypothetical protein
MIDLTPEEIKAREAAVAADLAKRNATPAPEEERANEGTFKPTDEGTFKPFSSRDR